MNDRQQQVQIVTSAADETDGKKSIDCAVALGLAKKHQLKPAEIGAICDEEGIKIRRCQLGCFEK